MPLEVFYSYSHKDEEFRAELETHLKQLQRSGLILPWHDRRIEPGDNWRNQIDAHVRSAHIILLLISADFLASDYCYDVEMKVALERHSGPDHAIVIPIIVRPCDWSASPFAHIQALPRDAKAITLAANRDQAFAEIARAIREIIVRYRQQPAAGLQTPFALVDSATPKPRVLDAAMPSHIVKDRGTELLVQIRLPDSAGLTGFLQMDDEAEARPEDVRSKPFDVTFPLGPTGLPEPLKVAVKVTSPDFSPPSQSNNLLVPVNADSEVCAFMLTPLRMGALMVFIELQWEDAQRGVRRLRTTCITGAEMGGINPVMNVVQMPVGVASAAQEVPLRLTNKFASQSAASYDLPAPAAQPVPMAAAASASKRSFLSNPALKVAALVICVVGAGTFWITNQPNGAVLSTPSAGPVVPAAPPPKPLSTQAAVESAAVEFEKASRAVQAAPLAERKPEAVALIKTGQESLAAAKKALAQGDQVAVRLHLQQVRMATRTLTRSETPTQSK